MLHSLWGEVLKLLHKEIEVNKERNFLKRHLTLKVSFNTRNQAKETQPTVKWQCSPPTQTNTTTSVSSTSAFSQ